MTHQENRSPLEHRRLLRLAKEYQEKGFEVILDPSPDDLPPDLAGCSLDLVAVSTDKTIAAEVRSRETLALNGSEDLRHISEKVQMLPGWEFELVITNPRKKSHAHKGQTDD
ncbi:hypothetical protein C7B61_14795 [filamentous cyanobacterium CCP1]|nr:hypothetical protein C7B76_24275 [filamentous cyanobacterium CCP2]PSB62245.1 hypothetical protein C7B61_14795 [filamentous cyanobacterium CCP1]